MQRNSINNDLPSDVIHQLLSFLQYDVTATNSASLTCTFWAHSLKEAREAQRKAARDETLKFFKRDVVPLEITEVDFHLRRLIFFTSKFDAFCELQAIIESDKIFHSISSPLRQQYGDLSIKYFKLVGLIHNQGSGLSSFSFSNPYQGTQFESNTANLIILLALIRLYEQDHNVEDVYILNKYIEYKNTYAKVKEPPLLSISSFTGRILFNNKDINLILSVMMWSKELRQYKYDDLVGAADKLLLDFGYQYEPKKTTKCTIL